MKIPHPGELRQLVEIGCTVHEINENGFPVETEQVVCQVWAKVEDCDSRYFTSGDVENTERGIWITIAGAATCSPACGCCGMGRSRSLRKSASTISSAAICA